MQYLLLIYGAESDWNKLSETETQKVYAQYRELIQDLTKAGNFLGGHQLQPVSTATTVRMRSGKKGITDGPFAALPFFSGYN